MDSHSVIRGKEVRQLSFIGSSPTYLSSTYGTSLSRIQNYAHSSLLAASDTDFRNQKSLYHIREAKNEGEEDLFQYSSPKLKTPQ